MKLFESAFHTLKNYADFSGRASRSEFWYFFAFVLITQAVARVLDGFFGRGFYLPGPISSLTAILLFVPQLAVAVRRLHDVGRSGRELLVPVVMLLGLPIVIAFSGVLGRIVAMGYYGFVLIMFAHLLQLLVRKGRTIPNKYGASPTAFSFAR